MNIFCTLQSDGVVSLSHFLLILLVYLVENNKIALQKQTDKALHVTLNLNYQNLQTIHNVHTDGCEFTHVHSPTNIYT